MAYGLDPTIVRKLSADELQEQAQREVIASEMALLKRACDRFIDVLDGENLITPDHRFPECVMDCASDALNRRGTRLVP